MQSRGMSEVGAFYPPGLKSNRGYCHSNSVGVGGIYVYVPVWLGFRYLSLV